MDNSLLRFIETFLTSGNSVLYKAPYSDLFN